LRAILRQEIAFFETNSSDDTKNTDRSEEDSNSSSSGALIGMLSTGATKIAGLSGATLGAILNLITTVISAFTLSVAIGWKLGLVCSSTIPILLVCGYLRVWLLVQFERKANKTFTRSAAYATEATYAIRTIASLNREQAVASHYRAMLMVQVKSRVREVVRFEAPLYALSQSAMFLASALGFWYGGTLISSGEYSVLRFFICFMSIVWGSQSAGGVFSYAPDMGSATQATTNFKTLVERKPCIAGSEHTAGEKSQVGGGVLEFRSVEFSYPARPGYQVLRGLDLTIFPGQYVALVGRSGCGKSTIIGLIERFYDAAYTNNSGIFLNGKPISGFDLTEYRNTIALVSQEPTLFNGTIRENICLGLEAEEVAIIAACKDANIFDFIVSSHPVPS
jgi:ATP-binding cassette, subfamily B (MDR/TAP), member 1